MRSCKSCSAIPTERQPEIYQCTILKTVLCWVLISSPILFCSISGCGKPKLENDSNVKANDSDVAPPLLGWQVIAGTESSPVRRSRHGLAYDSASNVAVMFGGLVWEEDESFLLEDTWEFDGLVWREIDTKVSPSARHRPGMVFAKNQGKAVLFGGADADGLCNDTWIYSNQKWRELALASSPPARAGHSFAYDESSKQVVLFGGLDDNDKSYADTWIFDGTKWEAVVGSGPPARRYAAFAYDPGLGGCLLHGGAADDHGETTFGEAWIFKNRKWTRLPKSYETSPRDDHGLLFHHGAQKMVMLEGVAGERGLLVYEENGWQFVESDPMHPRHQCSQLIWNERLNRVMFFGGEAQYGGPQFDATFLLSLPSSK